MDWENNQFHQAEELYEAVNEAYPDSDISLTGHCLGGGLAQYVAARQDVSGMTRLMQQEQKMRSIHGRLQQDWIGTSATELTRKMQSFMEGASAKLTELEAHKEELMRYIRKMEEADREDRSRVL
ncbi:hypothetical protein [Paenibacillus xylanivorans]|uniref:hypothetical protein n=1 Tax=Paenibacillus xylanivorans TaxID=1705561 RepID=UPI0006B20881|nr:hypothetical protein [Paenibacillus xylanivorans]